MSAGSGAHGMSVASAPPASASIAAAIPASPRAYIHLHSSTPDRKVSRYSSSLAPGDGHERPQPVASALMSSMGIRVPSVSLSRAARGRGIGVLQDFRAIPRAGLPGYSRPCAGIALV